MSSVDQYGGTSALGTFERTGKFRLALRGNRHLLVTPDGNGSWLRACYGVDITDGGQVFLDTLKEKYRSHPTYKDWGYWFAFVENATRLLKNAGFNALGEYSSNYAWPIDTIGRSRSNSEKLPFIAWSNMALYCQRPPFLVKDIQFGVDADITKGLWRAGGFPDVFDPMFERAYEHAPAPSSPWLLGVSLDDRDYLFGFGPAREFGGWHHHLGWIAAATRPAQQKRGNVTYTDQRVHTKLALRDWLRRRYDSLSAFNRAWGATYTTWDSENQTWPQGRGFLDESGRSRWLGRDFYAMKDAHPQVKQDLDQFVGAIADRYFSVATAPIRKHLPGHLVFSPMPISALAHEEIVKSAGRWCDALQLADGDEKGNRRAHKLAQKPFFLWATLGSQADSPLAGRPGFAGADFPTQRERGLAYAAYVKNLIAFRGADGSYPCIGFDWWAYCDKVTGGEGNNFGLVTVRDNPYDGKAARRERGIDASGYPIGGEARDYGDFLSIVRATNASVPELVKNADGSAARSLFAMAPAALALGLTAPASRRELLRRSLGAGAALAISRAAARRMFSP